MRAQALVHAPAAFRRRGVFVVDALFKPHGIVLEEALAVAAELDLPRWWLNEQASSHVAPGGDSAASPGIRPSGPSGLRRLSRASPGYESARSPASRRGRHPALVQVLGLRTVDDVLASVRKTFPEEEPPARFGLLLRDIFADQDR